MRTGQRYREWTLTNPQRRHTRQLRHWIIQRCRGVPEPIAFEVSAALMVMEFVVGGNSGAVYIPPVGDGPETSHFRPQFR